MTNLPDVSFDPTNPDPRCACVLVLDTSGSMHGEKIDQLNQGLAAFRDSLQTDSVAQSRVEIAIVTFGPAQLLQDFSSASQFNPPTLVASGDTPLGAALQQALDMITMRKKLSVGVEGADMEVLKQLSTRPPLPLKGYSFREMFVWLSASLGKVSQSQPGQQVPLTPPEGWTTV